MYQRVMRSPFNRSENRQVMKCSEPIRASSKLAVYGGREAANRGRACQGRGGVQAGSAELGQVREEDQGPLAGELPGQRPAYRRVGGARLGARALERGGTFSRVYSSGRCAEIRSA